MSYKEKMVQTLTFYGRLADEVTREVIPFKSFQVAIEGVGAAPLYKEDGTFAFSGVEASASNYRVQLSADYYRSRVVEKALPPNTAVELSFDGEDELYVVIDGVQNGVENKVTFSTIPFVKTIPAGAPVYGENGFSTILTSSLEGEDIGFAVLKDVSGLSAGEILRFVRGSNIIMRPGPYYPFRTGTTLAALKFGDNSTPDLAPVAGVKCRITELNDIALDTTDVGGLDIYSITLPGPTKLVLGSDNDITTWSDERGYCVFYYYLPGSTPIAKLKLQIDADGYSSLVQDVTVTPGGREFLMIELTKA
jgi:hypothetical protein